MWSHFSARLWQGSNEGYPLPLTVFTLHGWKISTTSTPKNLPADVKSLRPLNYLLCFLPFIALARSCAIGSIQERSPDATLPKDTPLCPNYCSGTAFNASLTLQYFCGDSYLGPVHLPTAFPLSGLFSTYDRFGGLCPSVFLAKWYNATVGSFIYRPDNGFQLDNSGGTILGNVTLSAGLLIDRFGSEYGKFVDPEEPSYI